VPHCPSYMPSSLKAPCLLRCVRTGHPTHQVHMPIGKGCRDVIRVQALVVAQVKDHTNLQAVVTVTAISASLRHFQFPDLQIWVCRQLPSLPYNRQLTAQPAGRRRSACTWVGQAETLQVHMTETDDVRVAKCQTAMPACSHLYDTYNLQ
jgi:hypothetical protein